MNNCLWLHIANKYVIKTLFLSSKDQAEHSWKSICEHCHQVYQLAKYGKYISGRGSLNKLGFDKTFIENAMAGYSMQSQVLQAREKLCNSTLPNRYQ